VKVSRTGSLNFKKIEEGQIIKLHQAATGTVAHKISDMSPGMKPFDLFVLYKVPSYIAICYYKPREKKVFYFVDIQIIIEMIDEGKKSLSEMEAGAVAKMLVKV